MFYSSTLNTSVILQLGFIFLTSHYFKELNRTKEVVMDVKLHQAEQENLSPNRFVVIPSQKEHSRSERWW